MTSVPRGWRPPRAHYLTRAHREPGLLLRAYVRAAARYAVKRYEAGYRPEPVVVGREQPLEPGW